jgi:elongation factor P
MLTHSDLRKGARFIMDGLPYEVLEAMPLKKAQRRVVIQTRIKSLINGNVFDRNFHQGDVFEEAELEKFDAKFIYQSRGKYFFCDVKNPSKRFDLPKEQIGNAVKFLKPNEIVQAIVFDEKIISISLPIKVNLKVTEAPPGVKGDSAQAGTKIVILESGAQVSVPLFVNQDDVIEVNTETGEYVRRVE